MKRLIWGGLWVWALASSPEAARAMPPLLTNEWSVLVRSPMDSSPAIGDDGAIYFGSWKGDLRALNADGSPRWLFHAGREIKSSPALGPDSTVYFGCRDRKFYAVGPDGKKRWDFRTGAWVDSSPALAADGTIYFGSWDKSFYALSPGGSKKWQFQTAGEIVSSPAVDADGRVYFGSHDGKFYALSPAGSKVWEYVTAGPIISSPAIDKDGTMYFTSVDGFFYAVRKDGSLKWRLNTGGITESSPVIGQDGALLVGVNNALWAITPQGKKKWDYVDFDFIDASPLALADGSVCAVSRFGQVVDFDSKRGPADPSLWYFHHGFGGTLSPAVGPKGVIYVAGHNLGIGDTLFALRASAPVAASPWPKFRGTQHNDGRQHRATQ
jgi:outer membrane protein assembly factor BamB